MTSRRFPPPWQVEQIAGGFKVLDASGQALVYIYARETRETLPARLSQNLNHPDHLVWSFLFFPQRSSALIIIPG